MAQSLARRLRPAADRGLTSPDPVRTRTPKRHTGPSPGPGTPDTPQNRQRQAKHALKQLVEARDHNRRTRHSTGGFRLRGRRSRAHEQPSLRSGEDASPSGVVELEVMAGEDDRKLIASFSWIWT
jgi:hypothetical protein